MAYDGTLKFDTSIDKSGFENGLDSLGSIAQKGMSVLTGAVTAAIGTVSTLGLEAAKIGSGFDSAMSQVQATLGYSVDAVKTNLNGASDVMEALTAKAEEMGKATAFSASQAADGLNILAMSGYSAEDSMGMIENVLNLASAGGLSLAEAATYAAGSMKGFKAETDGFASVTEASAYFSDIIAKGATLAATNVQQLGEALSQASSSAAGYGQTSQATEVALLRLAEQNEVGSAAATALAAAMKDIYTPTNQAKTALESLGVSAYDANGQAKDFNAVVNDLGSALAGISSAEERTSLEDTIFGIQGKSAFDKMIATSADKVQQFYSSLEYNENGSLGSAALQAEAMLDNLQGDLTLLQSATEGLGVTVYKSLDAPLRELVQLASEYIGQLSDAFEAGGFEGLAQTLGDVLSDAVTKLASYLPEVLKVGNQVILGLLDGISENAPQFVGILFDLSLQLIDGLLQSVPRIMTAGATMLKAFGTALQQNSGKILKLATKLFTEFRKGIAKQLPDMTESGLEALEAFLDSLGNSAELKTILVIAGKIMSTLADDILQAVPILIEHAPEIIKSLVEILNQNADSLTETAVKLVTALIDGLTDTIPVLLEHAPEIVTALAEGLQEHADEIKSVASTLLTKLGEALKDLAGDLQENAPEIMQNVATALKEAVTGVADIADAIISGIADALGLADAWQTVKDKISEAISGIDFDTIKLNLKIAVEDVPEDVKKNAQVLFDSLKDSADRVKKSFRKLQEAFANVKKEFQPLTNSLKSYFDTNQAGTDASNVLSMGISLLAGAIGVLADVISRVLSGAMNFATWLTEDNAQAEYLRTGIIALIGAVSALAVGFGTMEVVLQTQALFTGLSTTVTAMTSKMQVLFATLASNPIILLVASLGALIAILIHVMQTSEEWQAGWQTIKDTCQELWDSIQIGIDVIKDFIAEFVDNWKTGEQALENFGGKVFDTIEEIKQFFRDLVDGATQWGKDIIQNFIDGVQSKWNDWENMWEDVGGVVYDLLHHTHPERGLLKDDNTWMPDMMMSFAQGIKANVPLVESQAENLTNALDSALDFESPAEIAVDFAQPDVFTFPELPDFQAPDFSEIPQSVEFPVETPEPEQNSPPPTPPKIQPPEFSDSLLQSFQNLTARLTVPVSPNPVSQIISNQYQYTNTTNQPEITQQPAQTGDIIIPVSIGGQQLETLVISAIQIENARSGGRTI